MARNDADRLFGRCKATRKGGQPCRASAAATPAARPASSLRDRRQRDREQEPR